jgi:hypothetical protein
MLSFMPWSKSVAYSAKIHWNHGQRRACVEGFIALEEAVLSARFEVMEADYQPDARPWWQEYARYGPTSRQDPLGEAYTIAINNGR